jgi:hypothetical protein
MELGFFSVRHSAIFEQVVDFEEHCVGKLWVVCSWALKNRCVEITNSAMLTQFGFYSPRPNCQHVPEWLEEASCNSR